MPPDLSEQQRRNQLDRTQQDKKVLYKLFPLGSIGAFPKHVPIDVAGEKRNFLRPNTFGKHWIKLI